MNNRILSYLLVPLLIVSCDTSEDNEYFCESTRISSDNSTKLYFQSSVKINKNGMCLYHRSTEYCSVHGKTIDGFIDTSDWDKNLIHSEKYLSSVNGENYIFNVSKKYELRKHINVETKQIGDALHFSFEDKTEIPFGQGTRMYIDTLEVILLRTKHLKYHQVTKIIFLNISLRKKMR